MDTRSERDRGHKVHSGTASVRERYHISRTLKPLAKQVAPFVGGHADRPLFPEVARRRRSFRPRFSRPNWEAGWIRAKNR